MRTQTVSLLFALVVSIIVVAVSLPFVGSEPAYAQQTEDDVPPGNPVIGSDRPGDVEPENDDNYRLWALLAVCLIGAGFLLVRIERWERRRTGRGEE